MLPDRAAPRRPLPPRRRARRPGLVAVALVVLVAVGCGGDSAPDSDDPAAVDAGVGFLGRYVEADGRVHRIDQGDDTVSEGQAYAMLVAVAIEDRETFDRVWEWTKANLQRSDGLLSWHWANGAVTESQPAADADLDAAWALALASNEWGGDYATDAKALSDGLLRHEVTVIEGRVVLVAGPWANAEPATINPSYASPIAANVLQEVVGSGGASQAVDGLLHFVGELITEDGVAPDWAEVGPDGTAEDIPGPGQDGAGTFSWDAIRVPLRLAASCNADQRAMAAAHWAPMEAGAGGDALGDHAVRWVGAAAAAAAAGETGRAAELLDQAAASDERNPSYFGSALLAVGRLLLETDRLGGCPPLA